MKESIYNENHPVFQIDDPIVKEAYNNLDNYLIINNRSESSISDKLCVLYFSGHSIYYPNDKETFTQEILNKNRYEWFGIRIKEASKHIFLRDIHKQWYLTGINSDISSPEKLLEFLKKETYGYKIICIGSSAGGYASLLYGSYLKAEVIFAFSPQIELSSSLSLTNENIDPLIFRLKDTYLRKYFDITSVIDSSESNMIVCFPIKSEWDIRELLYLKSTNIINKDNFHIIKFNTKKHGVPFPKVALEKYFSSYSHKYHHENSTVYNPLVFSIQLVGFWKTLAGSYLQFRKYCSAKIKKYLNKISYVMKTHNTKKY